ncbi:MAG TPA: GxxExxY protein [Verrucomicrobiae bacterium]|nr:GxxExxY protein [Verrucomicrobiae bacterium]
MTELLYPKESYAIVGACFEVYNEMGCGFLEAVYQECLEIELRTQGIPFAAQPTLALTYHGQQLRQTHQPDFVCYDRIVLELKVAECLADAHRAQVLNYLHATGLKLGLLVNFGHWPKLDYERIALTGERTTSAIIRAHSPDSREQTRGFAKRS